MEDLLYLSAADVSALDLRQSELRAALTRSLRLHMQSRVWLQPKQTLSLAPGHFFQALCAASPEPPYAATKWIGVVAANAERQLAAINGLVILSDLNTGRPLAVIDANSLTVLRTAAMSALAAEHLARRDSTSIGFVGCGAQARGHLAALRDVLPNLRDVVCFSRTGASARTFAELARGQGLQALESTSPDDALACDNVVSTVPSGASLIPFLDAHRLRPGAFVSAVDLGRSWRTETFDAFDVRVVDDRAQLADPKNLARLAYRGPFDADLTMLVTGAAPGRADIAQRTLFLFPGFSLADLAVAGEVFERAVRDERGTLLKR